MKVWIVSHFWDNGEKYREDLEEYQDYKIFSTYEKAMDYYCGCICPEYIGRYTLDGYEVDTHEIEQLEKSPWVDCPSYADYLEEKMLDSYRSDNEPEVDYELIGSYWDENLERWRHGNVHTDWNNYPEEDATPNSDIKEELKAEREWLTHEGENKAIFDEIAKDKIDKLCANLVIEANTRNGGFCCNFSYGGANYYASLADLACVGTECMIFYEGDWTDLYCKRHIPLTEDSLKECVKEFLLSTL